ncbi:MAG: hypothetical protein SGILL_008313, partial [Bacillariaceae sp.]
SSQLDNNKPHTMKSLARTKRYSRQDLDLLNLLQHPCWVFDIEETKMYYANEAALELMDASSLQELLERDFKTGLTEATAKRMDDLLCQCAGGKQVREQWTIYPNGNPRTVLKCHSGIIMDDGRMAVLAETELPEQHEYEDTNVRTQELMRHVPVSVCQFALLGKDDDAENDKSNSTVEQTPTSMCLMERFVDKKVGEEMLHDAIHQGKHHENVELQQKLADGTSHWFSLSMQKATDPISGENVINYSALDVSEIIMARKETRKAQFKTEFLSVIAHELRTPLHQVIGYADMMEIDANLSPTQRDTVKCIQQASETLMFLINDLLDYSQIESSNSSGNDAVALKQVEFNMEELLHACGQAVETAAKAKGLSLELVTVADNGIRPISHSVVGDSGKVRQILANLLENAVKYTDSGGIVASVKYIEDNNEDDCKMNDDIDISISPRNAPQQTRIVRLEVKDTGQGIAPERRQIIFEKFHQGSNSSNNSNTRITGGIGLGLAICSGLAHQLNGSIGVDSEVGEGSAFWVELPLMFPSKKPSLEDSSISTTTTALPSGIPTSEPNDPILRILVAEDNQMNRKLVQRMLNKMGHTVYLVEDGEKAVEFLQQSHKVDIVLMDIQMPVMDGISATKIIRDEMKLSRQTLPIVGLTASFQHSDLNYYLDVGMNACLGKPVRLGLLKQTLASVAGRCMLGFYAEMSDE